MDSNEHKQQMQEKLEAANAAQSGARVAGKDPRSQHAGVGAANDTCCEREEPLSARMARRLMAKQHDAVAEERALGILLRHPEFEEFLWLLRSGLV